MPRRPGLTPAAHHRGDRTAELPAAVFVAAAGISTVLQAFWSRAVFLFWDDYYFLGEARGADLTREYLGASLFTHFSPLSRAVNWVVVDQIAAHPWVVHAILGVLLGAVVAASTWLMVVVFGRTSLALVGSLLLGTSLTLVPLGNWWTAGINILPGMAGSLIAMGGALRVVHGGSRWWAVACVGGLALGVLDYETPILIPAFTGLWVVLVLPGRGVHPVEVVRRTWWLWSAMGAVSLVALVNYRLAYYSPQPFPGLRELGVALLESLVGNLAPTVVGLHSPGSPVLDPLAHAVGTALVVCVPAWLLVTRRGAWRGLVFAGVGWIVPTLALLLNRLERYGPTTADDAIYSYLPTALVLLGVLDAWRAERRAAARARSGSPSWDLAQRVALPTLLLACVAAFVVSVEPTARYRIPTDADGRFVVTARRSAAATADEIGRFSVVDSLAKDAVMPAGYGGWARNSNVLGISVPGLDFGDPRPPYYRFDRSGELEPVDPVWERTVDFTVPGTPRGVLLIAGRDRRSDGDGLCFVATERTKLRWNFPVLSASDLVVRVLATTSEPAGTRLSVVRDLPGDLGLPYPEDPGDNAIADGGFLEIATGPRVLAVTLSLLTPGTTYCVQSISVGELRS